MSNRNKDAAIREAAIQKAADELYLTNISREEPAMSGDVDGVILSAITDINRVYYKHLARVTIAAYKSHMEQYHD